MCPFENWWNSIKKIGIDKSELKTAVFKNTGDDLSKSLSNFQELKESLAGTKYELDLTEVLI